MYRIFLTLITFCMTATTASAELSDAERTELRAEIRAYLLEQPEVLLEVMQALQEAEERNSAVSDAAALKANAGIVYNDSNSWTGGNLEGDITIVEFVDYRCGYCRRAYDDLSELVESDGNIRLVLKEFPILGPQSVLASRFAIAVRELYGDDAYKAAHDALITLRGDVTDSSLARLAKKLGHDSAEIAAQMNSAKIDKILRTNQQLAQILKVTGTPTFIIDDGIVRGYVPLEGMRQIVAQEREGA